MVKEEIESQTRQHKNNLYKRLNEHMAKSEEAFDKKLFAMSSGGLTLLFSEFAFNESHGNLLTYIIAVLCFVISLFLNLYIHKDNADNSKKILENGEKMSAEDISKKIRTINNKNECWTNANMILLFLGIISSFIYIITILR